MSNDISPEVSASHSKWRGYDKYRAWDQYVIDTWLRPTIGAKEFYEIYDIVTASAPSDFVVASPLPEDWMPTHYDTMMGRMVQAKRESGYYTIVWEDGHSGSTPIDLFESGRYNEL